MRMYQPIDQALCDVLPSEDIEISRNRYVGWTLTLMTQAGSAVVRVDAIGDDGSVCLTRQCRASAPAALVVSFSEFLAGLEYSVLVMSS
jgi:hypothetical protein